MISQGENSFINEINFENEKFNMIENIYDADNQINLIENRLISIAIMNRNPSIFQKLKGIKINQKLMEDKKINTVEIIIIMQILDSNASEFLIKDFTKESENLKEFLKIFYNIIIAIEYLK